LSDLRFLWTENVFVRVVLVVRRTSGPRRRTRQKFKKDIRKKGLPPVSKLLVDYELGDKVDIIIDPSVHKGMPHRRFYGRTAEVIGKRGRAYILKVRDGNSHKTVISRVEHIRLHAE